MDFSEVSSWVIPPNLYEIADVMPRVFGYLNLKEKVTASLACKYFKDIAQDWIRKFEMHSGLPGDNVKPFLIETLSVFPELAENDFTVYSVVQEFFQKNTLKTAARLDMGVQSRELVTEVLKGLIYSKEPIDSFNLYQAIVLNDQVMLCTMLDTIVFDQKSFIFEQYHEGDETICYTYFKEIVKFTLSNGSLETLKAVLNKLSVYSSNVDNAIKLLQKKFNSENLAKLDLIADAVDQKNLEKDKCCANLWEESEPHLVDAMCLETDEHPFKFTFGELLKAIARKELENIKVLITKVKVEPEHLRCADWLGYQEIYNLLESALSKPYRTPIAIQMHV